MARSWLFWLVIAGVLGVFVSSIQPILLPFAVGMAVAYFLDPAADRLEKWGCSRSVATAIITLSFFSLVVALLMLILPLIYHQLAALIAELPNYVNNVRILLEPRIQAVIGQLDSQNLTSAQDAASALPEKVLAAAGNLTQGLVKSGFALINLVMLAVITPVVSFYLLCDWDRIVASVDRLLPRAYADTIREQMRIIDDTIAGFVRGTLNVMLVLSVYYTIALSIMGLKFAVLMGLMTGALLLIPYLGTILSLAAAIGLAYMQFDSATPVIAVGCIYAVGQVMEGYILTPRLVGRKVGLHPLWLIFGMMAGATLFGAVGVFLAVPVTAVIGVLIRFAIQQYEQSPYYLNSKPQ